MAAPRKKPLDAPLHEQRVAILRQIAILVKQQQEWYTQYVLPAAAEARIATSGGKRAGQTKVLDLKYADMLDDSPTGRFEKGRAHIESLSSTISQLRAQEAALSREINRPPPSLTINWHKRLKDRVDKTLENK